MVYTDRIVELGAVTSSGDGARADRLGRPFETERRRV